MTFANHQPICIGYPGLFVEVPGHSNCRLSGISLVSSANFSTREELLIPASKSLIYIRKSTGPNTDPCSTPLVTWVQSEKILCICTISSSSFISFKNKIITENSSKKNKNNKNRTGEAKILLLPQPTVNERSKKNMY